MINGLQAVRALDAGQPTRKATARRVNAAEYQVPPYWDEHCIESTEGLSVAAVAAIPIAQWAITGCRQTRRGLLQRLKRGGITDRQATVMVDAVRRTAGGDQHAAAVQTLREALEQLLLKDIPVAA